MSNRHDSNDTQVRLGEGSNGEERRRHQRYLFSAAMTVRPSGEGDTVELDPVVGGRAMARVRHKLGRLYGFEFVDLTAHQPAQIAERCQRFGGYRRTAKGA
jgi:hypothetical protein